MTASENFNPRAPYGARLMPGRNVSIHCIISIHAPHTGRDRLQADPRRPQAAISIHAPHTGRDAAPEGGAGRPGRFQSTRPIRGATHRLAGTVLGGVYFNPRAPYGARRRQPAPLTRFMYFNPRAPYGARPYLCQSATQTWIFQSTRPIRGATGSAALHHSPPSNFNPRAPYGARPMSHS